MQTFDLLRGDTSSDVLHSHTGGMTSYGWSVKFNLFLRILWTNISKRILATFSITFRAIFPDFPAQFTPVLILNALITRMSLIIRMSLTTIVTQLFQAIDQAAQSCFPKILPRRVRKVPGWNVKAKSLKERAIVWDKIWKDCGCQSSGVLSIIKKNIKNHYKYEVQHLKHQAEHIKSEKLAEAWCNAHNTNFWHLVRQHGNSKSSGYNIIDGLTTSDGISFSKICSILNF